MLASTLLARTGATMVGLSIGFVAYEQTASATAALAALPLVQMMPAVTESLNRDAADRLGILVACVAVGSIGQVLVIERLRARHDARVIVGVTYAANPRWRGGATDVRHRCRPHLDSSPRRRRASRCGPRGAEDARGLEAEALPDDRPDTLRDDLRVVVPVEHDPAPIRTEYAIGAAHRGVELGPGPLEPIAGSGAP
jgi:hypothetical protein